VAKRSQRFGYDVPGDFPIEALEVVLSRTADDGMYAANLDLWRECAGGCNGTVYRFMSAARADDEWVNTYTDRPSIDLNVRQDQLLFEFFVAALSSLECLAYGLCAIGQYLRPDSFEVTTKPKSVTFRYAVAGFTQEFPDDPLAVELTAADAAAEMAALRTKRNLLAHRASPGRTFSESLTASPDGGAGSSVAGPTTWLDGTLGPDTTRAPRTWAANTLTRLLAAAGAFTAREL
jgi:hypothetical protein